MLASATIEHEKVSCQVQASRLRRTGHGAEWQFTFETRNALGQVILFVGEFFEILLHGLELAFGEIGICLGYLLAFWG